jgi:3-deoxy-7-phosphoheptulonate synthase
MIIVMRSNATQEQTREVVEYITSRGFTVDVFESNTHTMLGVLEDVTPLRKLPIDSLPGVERIISITKPFKLASRDFRSRNTTVAVHGREIGGANIVIIGEIGVFGEAEKMRESASTLNDIGVSILKPRPSAHAGEFSDRELQSLVEVTSQIGLPIMAEITSPGQAYKVEPYVDLLLVGSQNMDNQPLLEVAGKLAKPIVLERSMSGTVEDWLISAHLIISAGNSNVVLCDRGARTFQAQPALDVNDIASAKAASHLPMIVDAGRVAVSRESLLAVCRATVAAGVDGLVVPILDGTETQMEIALTKHEFVMLVDSLRRVSQAVDRRLDPPNTDTRA